MSDLRDKIEAELHVFDDLKTHDEEIAMAYDIIFDKLGISSELQQGLIKVASAPVIDYLVRNVLPLFQEHRLKHGPMVRS